MSIPIPISSRLPALQILHQEELKSLESKRRKFVRDFAPGRLKSLPLEQFAIGKGDRTTLCYRIERELDGLGRILGAPVSKFGVFHSNKRSGYECTSIWGASVTLAYPALLAAILELLDAAENDDLNALKASRISPMFKGKLLHVYFPEKFAPIYSKDHLSHFVSCLNLIGVGDSTVEHQLALMEVRRKEPLLASELPGMLMRFLYSEFPLAATNGTGAADDEDRAPTVTLSQALAGLQVLNALPPGNSRAESKPPKPGKYDAANGRRKYIGDRGEALVVQYEKRRLIAARQPGLANQVVHVAATDDSKGYDVLSFDDDGTPRQIEVKSTSAESSAGGFYLTENELRVSRELPNYHLYFIFKALSAKPRLFTMRKPRIEEPGFKLRPTQYHVNFGTSSGGLP